MYARDAILKLQTMGTNMVSMRRDTAILLELLMFWQKRAGRAMRKTYTRSGKAIAILDSLSSVGTEDVEIFWRPRNLPMVLIVRVIAASRRELRGGPSPVCELAELITLRREVNTAVRDDDNWPVALRRPSPNRESRKTRRIYEICTFPFCRPVIVLNLKLLSFTSLLRFLLWGSNIRVVWHVLGRILP